jgi:hypothetical protein
MKAYTEDRVYLHSFLMPTLDEGDWSASHFSCLTPGEGTPQYPLSMRLAGATEPVWIFWRREKYLTFARI